MQRGLNQVVLSGNIGSEPEIREFGEGDKAGKIVTITLATSTVWRTKDGENKEDTQWHRVALFGSTAKFAADYFKKGMSVLVVGMLSTRSYEDKEGQTRYITEVVVNPMENGIAQITGSRQSNEGGQTAAANKPQNQAPSQPAQQPAQPAQAPAQQAPVDNDDDDDIPF